MAADGIVISGVSEVDEPCDRRNRTAAGRGWRLDPRR
jgi:hypothetical protein